MLAIPHTAKVDFCFLTPNGINMPDWPSLATYGMNSVCLSERLTDIIRILGEHLKSKRTSFPGNVGTK